MSVKFIIGCDPELMIVDGKKNLKSCIPLIEGSKHSPLKINKGAVLSDNVNFEFNVTPEQDINRFIENIGTVLHQSVGLLGKDYSFIVRASANFPSSELEDIRAREFGCEPDYNAWTLETNNMDAGAANASLRSAGGHIHIGATQETKFLYDDMGKVRMIKAMDTVAGIISLLLDKDPTSALRRSLYGKAGSHRPKDYGVEYRAIGNFWVNSPKLVKLVYDLTAVAVELVSKKKEAVLIKKIGESKIINTINNSDVKTAEEIYNKHLKPILGKALVAEIETARTATHDFYKEWNLQEV